MKPLFAEGRATQIDMQAVVIRADGTRENLGTIAYWNKNPFKNLAFRARKFVTTGRTTGRITQGH